MNRRARLVLITVAAVGCALLLALSLYLRSWGGVALLLLAGAGLAWYRVQVVRGEQDAARFFADAGEDTRLTSFQPTGFQAAAPGDAGAEPTPPPRGERQG
ncbi:MAG: hypothetical protein ACO1OY_03805 [Ramlibacter sp.]